MEANVQSTGNQVIKMGLSSFLILACSQVMAQVGVNSPENVDSTIPQEGLSQTEIVSYIAMIVGFAVIVALAWFTSIRAKKRNEEVAHHHAIAGGHRVNQGNHGHHAHPYDPYRKARKKSR